MNSVFAWYHELLNLVSVFSVQAFGLGRKRCDNDDDVNDDDDYERETGIPAEYGEVLLDWTAVITWIPIIFPFIGSFFDFLQSHHSQIKRHLQVRVWFWSLVWIPIVHKTVTVLIVWVVFYLSFITEKPPLGFRNNPHFRIIFNILETFFKVFLETFPAPYLQPIGSQSRHPATPKICCQLPRSSTSLLHVLDKPACWLLKMWTARFPFPVDLACQFFNLYKTGDYCRRLFEISVTKIYQSRLSID